MAGKSQRSPRSLAPIEQQVLSAFRELLGGVSAEAVTIQQLHERLPDMQIATLSPILERLSRLGKLAAQKKGSRVEVIYSSSEILSKVMAAQHRMIMDGHPRMSIGDIDITRRTEEPCEHAREVLVAYEKLVADFQEVSSKLQEAEQQTDRLVRDAKKALNKQRKAEADRNAAQVAAEASRRKAAANTSEVSGLRKQIEELAKQVELIPALQAKIQELEDRETVRGPLADRIIPFFA